MLDFSNTQTELFPELGPSKQFLPEQDGLYSDYGAMINVFPRTMNEAYGRYEKLTLPSKTNYKELAFWLYVIALAIIAFLVMRVDPADAFIR